MAIEKHHVLITLAGIRDLDETGADFEFRYDLAELGSNGRPLYNCIYRFDDEDHILISDRATAQGVVARRLSLWPGLFRFNQRHRAGADIVLHDDLTISVDGVRGKNLLTDAEKEQVKLIE